MQKAIFLDRDGVINIDKDYIYEIEKFEFIDGVFESLVYLQNIGYKLFIVTNQSGIGRGYYTLENFNILTSWMLEKLKEKNIIIDEVQLCPHSPESNCTCRKPAIGMIESILKNNKVDLSNSWLIGDKSSDIKCAINANIKNTIQVQSGKSFDKNESLATYICKSIKDIPTIIKE